MAGGTPSAVRLDELFTPERLARAPWLARLHPDPSISLPAAIAEIDKTMAALTAYRAQLCQSLAEISAEGGVPDAGQSAN